MKASSPNNNNGPALSVPSFKDMIGTVWYVTELGSLSVASKGVDMSSRHLIVDSPTINAWAHAQAKAYTPVLLQWKIPNYSHFTHSHSLICHNAYTCVCTHTHTQIESVPKWLVRRHLQWQATNWKWSGSNLLQYWPSSYMAKRWQAILQPKHTPNIYISNIQMHLKSYSTYKDRSTVFRQ